MARDTKSQFLMTTYSAFFQYWKTLTFVKIIFQHHFEKREPSLCATLSERSERSERSDSPPEIHFHTIFPKKSKNPPFLSPHVMSEIWSY